MKACQIYSGGRFLAERWDKPGTWIIRLNATWEISQGGQISITLQYFDQARSLVHSLLDFYYHHLVRLILMLSSEVFPVQSLQHICLHVSYLSQHLVLSEERNRCFEDLTHPSLAKIR